MQLLGAIGSAIELALEKATTRHAQRVSAGDEVESFRRTVLVRQAEAEAAFHRGDPGPRMELWSRREPLTLFGAAGTFESGWEQLRGTFARVASRFSDVRDFRYDVLAADVKGDMAYAVGLERFSGSIDGGPVEAVTVRSTHVFRREDGAWRIVHRHGDNPPRDPRAERPADRQQQPGAFVTAAAAGEAIDSPGGSLAFLARGERTGGVLSAWESTVAPGHGPPLHLHLREDELMYVVEGHVRFKLEEAVHEASSGSSAFIPRGVPHTWQNTGTTPARLLCAFTPAAAGMERFFERAAALPADQRTAVAFGEFADDAGMVVLGPPLAQTHPPAVAREAVAGAPSSEPGRRGAGAAR